MGHYAAVAAYGSERSNPSNNIQIQAESQGKTADAQIDGFPLAILGIVGCNVNDKKRTDKYLTDLAYLSFLFFFSIFDLSDRLDYCPSLFIASSRFFLVNGFCK